MAWTAPANWPTGLFVTETFLHANVRDNLIELRQGGLAISGQATNRIPYASSATQLATSASLNFDGTTLSTVAFATGTIIATSNATTRPIQGLGSDSATSAIVASLYSNTSGRDSVIHLSDAFTYNLGMGADVNGSFNVWAGRSPGVAGTSVFSVSAAAAVTGGLYNGQTISAAANFTGSIAAAGTIKSSAQPGFLAYNSATDSPVNDTDTIDFDTEVYDELGNFSGDVFTAPVAGRYLFTVAVTTNAGSITLRGFDLVTSNRTYRSDNNGVPSGSDHTTTLSVIADMDTSDTARVNMHSSTGLTVLGGASPLYTTFAGRLLP